MAATINIPYRCPNCGDSGKFETLQELRTHLQAEHALNFDNLQRRTNFTATNQVNIIGHKLPHHSSLLELFHADARKLEEELKMSKEEELNNKWLRSECERLSSSSRISVTNKKSFERCPPKATFREYGHSSRLNKGMYINKLTNADKFFENPHNPLHNNSDIDDKNDSSLLENKEFSLLDKMFSEQKNKKLFHHVASQSSNEIKTYQDHGYQLPQNRFDNKHAIVTLNALSHDVLLERASQHATANSLYTAHEVLSGIEQAAEERLAQQQFVTDALAHELKEKEKRLANVMHEMESLHCQQLDTVDRINLMKQKYEYENKKLQTDLQQKQSDLDFLNKQITETKKFVMKENETIFQRPERLASNGTFRENKPLDNNVHSAFSPVSNCVHKDDIIENTQSVSENVAENLHNDKLTAHEMSDKENDLTIIKRKVQQLERGKQNLLMEMQNLLEAASADNDKLRAELDSGSEKLSKLNYDLEQSKQEQAELLDETNALYHQADVSLSILKTMLKEREHQLVCMSDCLEQAKTNQVKLVKERDECILLAKEKEEMYKSLLAANSSQVKSIKDILESNQLEKHKLEKGVCDLREKLAAKDDKDRQLTDDVSRLKSELAEKEKTQNEMQEKVRRREEKLRKARCEMERVTKYLKTTAEKELEARSKLETFISGLINRAGRAEAELKKLKSQQLAGLPKKFSRHGDASHLNQKPNMNHKVLLQGNFSTSQELLDPSASDILNHPHYHSQKSQQHFRSKGTTYPKDAFNTSASNSHHSDNMTKHRSPLSVAKNNSSSKKYYAGSSGHKRHKHLENPLFDKHLENSDDDIKYRQSLISEASLHPSPHKDASHLIFENTPEVDRIIHNVSRQTNTKPFYQVQSQKWHKADGDKVEQLLPVHRKQDSIDFPIDDNGIMWEQVSLYNLTDANEKLNDKYRLLNQERVEHQRLNEDTDVDEDLTDYIHEEEEVPYDMSVEAINLLPVSKTRVTAHHTNHIPLSEKIMKHSSSMKSAGSQTNGKRLHSQNLQESKLNFEHLQNNNIKNSTVGQLRVANDYSSTESSEGSPLYKARAVQKRVEQLTSLNSSSLRASSSSKQSVGFEVNHVDEESDLSSSSYASLGYPRKLLKKEENKQPTEEEVSHESAVQEPYKPAHLSYTGDEIKNNSKDGSHIKELYNPAQVSTAVDEMKNNSKDNSNVVLDSSRLKNVSRFSSEPNHGTAAIFATAIVNNSGHSATNLSTTHTTVEQNSVINCENIERLTSDLLHENNKGSLDSLKDYVLAENTPDKILENQELTKCTYDEQIPTNEMKVQITSQSETLTSSSEEELLDDYVSPQRQSLQKMGVDASTDTDLEKLAMSGQLQKGFAVKKNVQDKKRIIRKKSRPKALVKKFTSQESLSSEPESLVDEEKIKRLAARKMRVALFLVFSYLDTRTLLTIACVSREWCRISRHPALWRLVLLTNSSISSEFLITLSKWCTQTKSLSLKGLQGRGIMAEESPENYQLAIRGSLEQGLETFLSTCHDTITEIHISDCDTILTDKCLWLVSGYCRLLTTLTYLSTKDPVTPQLMWALGGGCPGITRLFVQPQQPCEKTGAMNNRCLLLIAQLYQDIEELGLGGKEFDKAGLLPLITSCQRLKSLHMDHCLAITADLALALCKAGLKNLHTLAIFSTYVEAKAIQTFKESCRQLKRIHVSVNIQDCVENPSKSKDKEIYKKMVKDLQALKAKPGFGIIFSLEAMSVN